jgi:uncharacterized membrane protein YkgB
MPAAERYTDSGMDMARTLSTIDLEQRVERYLPTSLQRTLDRIDERLSAFMERYGVTILRLALAAVFIWFGVLKVIGRSPVEDLVASTVYWLPADAFVRFLGVWEIIVGLGLLVPVALRLTLLLFWAQMAGTFLVLIVNPQESFTDGNPFLLSTIGEFVIKNLVLIAAGIVVGSTIHRRRHEPPSEA